MKPLLETKSLGVTVANNLVCRDLDLTIKHGEKWGILGVNGIGKTTLLHTLAGLRAYDRGNIYYGDTSIDDLSNRQRAKHRGVLFQDKSDPFPATVLESVLIGRHPYIDQWQWESPQDVDIARQSIADMGMKSREHQLVNTLSGGERQRAAIATLLTQKTRLLLLDEPTSHLDLKQQMKVMNKLSQLAENDDTALCMILHDLNTVSRFCNKVLMLFGNGESAQGNKEEMLNSSLLNELYGYPVRKLNNEGIDVFVPG